MYHLAVVLILINLKVVLLSLHPNAGLNIIQIVTKYGYPIESHQVQTDDGYILTLHRIPHGRNGTTNSTKDSVFLMHGLWSSSVDWINMGPGSSLGFILADKGYDVWLGNQRGNTWSRKHIKLNPDKDAEKFFDFTYHEIGIYDLPAKINYILAKTHRDKIYYVGHSQGTTDFFVMCSERPEYNQKIKLMTALAPVAYSGNIPHPLITQVVDSYYDLILTLSDIFQIHELMPHYQFITDLGNKMCSEGSQYQEYCSWVLNFIAGFDSLVDPNFIPVITTNTPAGSSMKQILHLLQGVKFGNFTQYDYGTNGNIKKYGQGQPPIYNISKITAPISLYYANNDWLTATEDVLKLAEALPNLQESKLVPYEEFNHLEFLWARNVVDLLYNDVVNEINRK